MTTDNTEKAVLHFEIGELEKSISLMRDFREYALSRPEEDVKETVRALDVAVKSMQVVAALVDMTSGEPDGTPDVQEE